MVENEVFKIRTNHVCVNPNTTEEWPNWVIRTILHGENEVINKNETSDKIIYNYIGEIETKLITKY